MNEDQQNRLEDLDTTLVTIPLLQQMRKSDQEKSDASIDVIIEVNLLHPEPRHKTYELIEKWVAELADDTEPMSSGEYHDQYVFASLTSSQIRLLAKRNETFKHGRRKAESATGFGTNLRCPIYKIWPDFDVELQVNWSHATVKADAAQIAFAASGKDIVWALIDTGIDGKHPHFKKHSNLEIGSPLYHMDFSGRKPRRIEDRRELNDPVGHGTHLAGIISGELSEQFVGDDNNALVRSRDESGEQRQELVNVRGIKGIAPQCKVLSLNVWNDEKKHVKASRVIAALAYVNRVNGDGRIPKVHGVNISLGHEFDPTWFACGQSPLCVEVDRLVRAGTVVVVAAGNGGYGTVKSDTKGDMKAGLVSTLRDPANAKCAITVGSTHCYMPHAYGVSYFSAKGPTGDGRLKPDVVAPGEKIISCASSQAKDRGDYSYMEQSGTSMAAAHVSGCVAAFLSIRSEFSQQPERIKEIFLKNATDLGRERYYQGHGLVDLMRAIQSV